MPSLQICSSLPCIELGIVSAIVWTIWSQNWVEVWDWNQHYFTNVLVVYWLELLASWRFEAKKKQKGNINQEFSPACKVHIEDCNGWWLPACHSSVADTWLVRTVFSQSSVCTAHVGTRSFAAHKFLVGLKRLSHTPGSHQYVRTL